MKLKTTVEPHALTRRDRPTLKWSVEEVLAKRGMARTDIVGRKIYAPAGLSDLERVVRAHELMHARITPAESIEDWLKRGLATFESLQAVEEVRVNYAISKAGFDLGYLTDGNEDADGEMAVINEDWRSAVIFAVATAGTAGGKRFLVGVRRQSKHWANALQKIQKHVWKQVEGADTGRIGRKYVAKAPLFSTEVHRSIGLAPAGFAWTEQWAEYLDRLSELPPPSKADKPVRKKRKGEESAEGSEDGELGDEGDDTSEKEGDSHEISNKGEGTFEDRMRDLSPLNYGNHGTGQWGKLIWGKTILTRINKGTLGRRRIAQQYGRNPRRIGRLYTDPQRRVFDHERRAKGGIVLIDGSGSMCLTHDDVIRILKVAPGATVAIYSDMDEGAGRPNIHILAKDGKCVEEKNMPEFGAGNGVDLPALEWAIEQRKNKEPIVWVTDGGVCVSNCGFNPTLAMQCIKTAKRNKVVCVDHVNEAVTTLKSLNNGKTTTNLYPRYFRQVIETVGGIPTRQETSTK